MRLVNKYRSFPSRRAGVSLVELMVALAILTIGVVGLMDSFQFIQKGVQISKNKTLASNLAQEKMQILKQKSYYQVIVTSAPAHNIIDFAPDSVDYDTGYFPPEEITEAGVTYTRYTYVQSVMEDAGALVALAPNIPDTGMKRIIVTVAWGYGSGKRKVTVRSILANPDTVISNVVFNGVVKTTATTVVAIGGALVRIVEGAGWSDTTNSSGQYNINATPGNYTLMASATGYYTAMKSMVIAAGTTLSWDFPLRKIATGRIIGYPWLTDHLVISQVVGSTKDVSGFDQEYVEVFNPSTYTWNMGNIGLKFQRAIDSSKKTIQILHLFPSPGIASGGYYLFADTETVVAAGNSVGADAVWASGNSSYFPNFVAQGIIPVDEDAPGVEGGGAIELYRVSDGAVLDRVGWDKSGHLPPFYEGSPIIQTAGLSRTNFYARLTSTSDISAVNWNFGPAYDSNNNNIDFSTHSTLISAPPHSSDSGGKTVISGTPAVGAVISCSDGLSASTVAVISGIPPYARFSLVDVATGSWTVLITSGVYGLEKLSVPIPDPGGSVYTFVSSSTLLTQSNSQGIIAGRVLNVLGAPLNSVDITGGAGSTNTGTDGRYWLRVNPGTVDITVTPSGGTANYVTASSNTIPIEAGQVHGGVDFVLYQGGRVSGLITRDGTSSHGLPGVAVAIFDANSIARDQQVSGADGRFTSVVLSTGYYIVQPAIGALESSTPVSSTVTILTMGVNQFSSTFTISGALGYITGTVKSGGQPINTGVLIVVTTTTLPMVDSVPAPPDLSSATLTGPPLYLVSSMENGTYLAEVRNGSQYNVYAYYPETSNTGVINHSSKTATISVTAGQTTPEVNFSW